MQGNESYSILGRVRKDVNEWVKLIEIYFENHTLAHIIVKTFLFLVSATAVIVNTINLANRYWPPGATFILLLAIIVVAFVIDAGHVFLAKNRLDQLERAQRLTTNTIKIIRNATDLAPTSYKILNWEVTHDINDKGDVVLTRSMSIGYLNEPVFWARVLVGVIDGKGEEDPADLKIRVINPDDGGDLPWTTIENQDQRKILAVLLDPPAKLATNSSFRISLIWQGAYLPLISGKPDPGRLTVENPTDKITLVFIAPLGIEFQGIRMTALTGNSEIKTLDDGRSILTWSATNVAIGRYSYTLIGKRKEP